VIRTAEPDIRLNRIDEFGERKLSVLDPSVASKPPPVHGIEQVALMTAEESGDHEWRVISRGKGDKSSFGRFIGRPDG
jgi:hypothetical protein